MTAAYVAMAMPLLLGVAAAIYGYIDLRRLRARKAAAKNNLSSPYAVADVGDLGHYYGGGAHITLRLEGLADSLKEADRLAERTTVR
ncbi:MULTISPECIES: hypothetical protein [unclassified Bradyrhizobium]|uniref:hypothetical protein n=1 Tax=unclassified Bradyrhizobium TaxID=2631580 RepID=UPI001E5F98B7|nr:MULTISPECIES: hypothetical protein [Bradyrhizobium]UFW71225.1 hypothetical protein BcanWU425_31710 [Bradyrhizobium canariense]WOH57502.1 hypothetical protein RX329_35625 [Bradyrhizobium sp. BWC-3-1]